MTARDDVIDPTGAAVVKATLLHVPFEGWTNEALALGAADAGVEPHVASALFPRGAIDAIALHSRCADVEMVAAFDALPEKPQKIHLAIRTLVLFRLEAAQSNKDAVRRALTTLALPMHSRISAVYSATLLAWLADNSGDMAKTAAFLDRRLTNVASIPKATAPLRGVKVAGEQFALAMLKTIRRRNVR